MDLMRAWAWGLRSTLARSRSAALVVGAVAGAACYLIGAVMTDGPGADYIELLID